jgi:hypothetical protein
MSQSDPEYVITLVHRTFAPNAAWTKPRSKLRRVIQNSLRDAGKVKFRRFTWRGFLGTLLNNGHRYRLAAGIGLAAKLEKLCKNTPRRDTLLLRTATGATSRCTHFESQASLLASRESFASALRSSIANLGIPNRPSQHTQI